MSGFEVGDNVVYAPHGAGVVVGKESRDDDFGEYLSIRVAHSKMTLMVPASVAADKGVRPIITADEADELLGHLGDDPEGLLDNPQHRARRASDQTRVGDATTLMGLIRDYTGRATGGKKLSATEQRTLTTATQMLASEIALAKDIEIADAIQLVETAVGIEVETDA